MIVKNIRRSSCHDSSTRSGAAAAMVQAAVDRTAAVERGIVTKRSRGRLFEAQFPKGRDSGMFMLGGILVESRIMDRFSNMKTW